MGTASSWTVSYEQQYLGTAWDQKPHLDIPLMFRHQNRQCLTERKKKIDIQHSIYIQYIAFKM